MTEPQYFVQIAVVSCECQLLRVLVTAATWLNTISNVKFIIMSTITTKSMHDILNKTLKYKTRRKPYIADDERLWPHSNTNIISS